MTSKVFKIIIFFIDYPSIMIVSCWKRSNFQHLFYFLSTVSACLEDKFQLRFFWRFCNMFFSFYYSLHFKIVQSKFFKKFLSAIVFVGKHIQIVGNSGGYHFCIFWHWRFRVLEKLHSFAKTFQNRINVRNQSTRKEIFAHMTRQME